MNKTSFWAVISLAIGHLVTDLQAGALPIVLPHLKEMFSLTYAQMAAIVLTQNVTSSVIQPVLAISRINAPCLLCCLTVQHWQVQALLPLVG